MYNTKSMFASKGVIGAAVVIGSTALQAVATRYGFSIGEADITEAINFGTQIAQGLGGIVALYGRIKATKIIG